MNSDWNVSIIVAAGAGERLSADRPKQFLELRGVPILIRTLRAFEACRSVDEVVLVLPPGEQEMFLPIAGKHGLTKITRFVAGGRERQDSVWNGLKDVDRSRTGIVAIHDGARPLITPEEISMVIEEARLSGAATIGYAVSDTLKQVDDFRIVRTVDRRRYWLVQTPQAFRSDLIFQAYQYAFEHGLRATDDSTLVEHFGAPVTVVSGSRENLKITWPEDLALAELLLAGRDM